MKLLNGNAFALLLIVSALFLSFKSGEANLKIYELTDIELSQIDELNSDQTSIFGIMAGMRMEDVEKKVIKRSNLLLEDDKLKKDRFYLYESINGSKGECLAYLVWNGEDAEMQRMVLYKAVHKYMPGHGEALFSKEALDRESYLFKNVLGKPDYKQITMNVEEIDLKHTSYIYTNQKLELIQQYYKGETEYMLVMHD